MQFTRRDFFKGGIAAFTVSFAAPAFLSDIARAQGASRRNLVVLYLSGGNDALSMLIPVNDPFYASRRPSLAVTPGTALSIGTDTSGVALSLHPRLTGLRTIFNAGNLAFIQRTGYQNSSRSHFLGTDIWSTASPTKSSGPGWLGRYLDALPSPVDPLVGWCTTREVPHTLIGNHVSVPSIPSVSAYTFSSPNTGALEQGFSRTAMTELASHLPVDQPHLSFVNGTMQSAIATIDRVATVGAYLPTVTYANDGLSQALRAVAGAMNKGIGTKVFWVQINGFDTHSNQQVNSATAGYAGLMNSLNNALFAFYNDLRNQGLFQDTMVLQFSEFGRRINDNGSGGCDHGAASVMMAMGGNVNGGLYGTAPNLNPFPNNPTLENSGGDVTFETDFRSVYARVIDNWLGADSVGILGGDFRKSSLTFI